MATVARTSQHFTFNDGGSHLREPSFSSYLRGGQEGSILKLGEPTRIPTSSVAAFAGPPYKLGLGRKYSEDGELDIFSADKYFNGGVDEKETANAEKEGKQHPNKDGNIDLPRPTKAFKWGTPSACSEASWNSQSALLHKNRSPNMQKQMSNKNFFGSFVCKCVGRKSVNIAKNVEKNIINSSECKKIVDLRGEPQKPAAAVTFGNGLVDVGKTRTILAGSKRFGPHDFHYGEGTESKIADKGNAGSKREDHFTFPNLNSVVGNLTVNGKQFEEEEKARISLEVFGSSYMVKQDMASNLHRKLSMLTSVPASSSGMDNGDLESDASSDLFEIESFSSKVHHPFFHPQDMYEPSEASIEWSVVTASAANFSVASDYDNEKPTVTEKIMTTKSSATKSSTSTTDKAQRRQPTSLLGCRSAKAVTVAANAQRVSEKSGAAVRRQLQSGSMVDFQADRQHAFAMHSIPRSYPSHAPHSLYMN